MKLFSLFSGIGAFEKALDNLEIPHELVGFSEIDKYAVKSYCAIHDVDESKNFGDITKINEKALPKDIDLVTYGFPCQDISLAGKQKGLFNADGSQTRSGLFFEALRIIEETKPRVAIAENVKNLTSKKFNAQFQIVLESLEQAGYNNYWQVLNAKDYGIPQNRERVFIVSIRKDIDTGMFQFPEGILLELRLKDMLEDGVDVKYYLSQEIQDRFQVTDETFTKNVVGTTKPEFRTIGQRDLVYQKDSIMGALVATDYKQPKQIIEDNNIDMVGLLPIKGNEQVRRVYGTNGIAPTLNTMQGGNRQPKIINEISNANKMLNMLIENEDIPDGKSGADCTINNPKLRDVANCIPARYDCGVSNYKQFGTSVVEKEDRNFYIRKLTPKECFRLMGFSDEDFEKSEKVNSDTQLYKQAGNSIVVPVVQYIIKALFDAKIFSCEPQENIVASVEDDVVETITPLKFAEEMARIREQGDDAEVIHEQADNLMCKVLLQLGYKYGVKIFEEMPKWYA